MKRFLLALIMCSSLTIAGFAGVSVSSPSKLASKVRTSLSVTATSLPSATAGSAYSTALTAQGGTSPYRWSLVSGELPAGLALSTAGVISGTPSVSGEFSFTVQVKDSAKSPQTASWSESISVAAAPALSVVASSLTGGTVGSPYSATLAAQGGIPPYRWSVPSGQLPVGLTLSSSGVIGGTPRASGTFTFVAEAKDSAASPQSASRVEAIAVSAAPAQITPPSQAAGYNLMFSDDFTALNISPDGEGDYTWYEGLWWNSTVSPRSDIAASDSILTLDWKSGQGTSDTDVSACSPNGQYCHAFRYGYFEARMKWDPATGSWPAFWLLPAEDITGLGVSNNESGEIDIFEGQGATPHTYFGTIHDWKDYVDIANNENTNAYELASTVDVTQYHTYGILWVPGTITWYFDNELLFSAATYEIFDQEYFYPILSSQEGADWTYGDMTGVTASSIPLNVDWIHVWQK